jgi:hypothetical protein
MTPILLLFLKLFLVPALIMPLTVRRVTRVV